MPAPLRTDGVSFRHGQNPSMRSRGPRRYGETDLSFPEDQVWVETPSECPAAFRSMCVSCLLLTLSRHV